MVTFLDVIAGQVLAARARTGARLPLIFMNSFRTADDTRAHLSRYPELEVPGIPADFLQNRVPKLDAATLAPVEWPPDPEHEWCPPGHGDIYPAMYDAGIIADLLRAGFRYLFVSNADNLGATPDARVAGWFAGSGAPFALEVSRKTPADIKGGHLVRRNWDQQLVLRESAQTHPEDLHHTLDIEKHRYFNTNNIWVDLEAISAELDRTGGIIELPFITNHKTVDPSDPQSPAVIQLESAMGSAVGVLPGAAAIEVGRERFLPVKTTDDLLLLRSDVFELTPDYRLHAVAKQPHIKLSKHYRTIADFEKRFPYGPPTLRDATALLVDGDWTFGADTIVTGAAHLPDGSGVVPDGTVLS
jgi:UTP--glucose-1-phosphate uridylyltransferase